VLFVFGEGVFDLRLGRRSLARLELGTRGQEPRLEVAWVQLQRHAQVRARTLQAPRLQEQSSEPAPQIGVVRSLRDRRAERLDRAFQIAGLLARERLVERASQRGVRSARSDRPLAVEE